MSDAYRQEHPVSCCGGNNGAADVAIRLADAEKPKRVDKTSGSLCARRSHAISAPCPAASPATFGCFSRYAAVRRAFALCRRMRKGSVSMPWIS